MELKHLLNLNVPTNNLKIDEIYMSDKKSLINLLFVELNAAEDVWLIWKLKKQCGIDHSRRNRSVKTFNNSCTKKGSSKINLSLYTTWIDAGSASVNEPIWLMNSWVNECLILRTVIVFI